MRGTTNPSTRKAVLLRGRWFVLRSVYATPGPIRHGYHFVTTFVLFGPAQTTMPSRPLKKEIRTRKFLKRASIYKQVYANKADIVSIGEYAKVRQANHTRN